MSIVDLHPGETSAADDKRLPLGPQRAPWSSSPKTARHGLPLRIADAVINAVLAAGCELRLHGGDIHLRENGAAWHVASKNDLHWLKVLVQQYAEEFGGDVRINVISAAWRRISAHPQLYVRNVDVSEMAAPADADAAFKRPRSRARRAILAVLDAATKPLGPTDIATACATKHVNTRFLLGEMLKDGEIEKVGYGEYRRRSETRE
jgi:predicted transcriptional regulator